MISDLTVCAIFLPSMIVALWSDSDAIFAGEKKKMVTTSELNLQLPVAMACNREAEIEKD